MALPRTLRAVAAVAAAVATAAAAWFRIRELPPFLDIHPAATADGWSIEVTARGDEPIEDVRVEILFGPAKISGESTCASIARGARATFVVVRTPAGPDAPLRVVARITRQRPDSGTHDLPLPESP